VRQQFVGEIGKLLNFRCQVSSGCDISKIFKKYLKSMDFFYEV